MIWWDKLIRRITKSELYGLNYSVVVRLYSGETYLSEEEWVEGTTFRNRHSGRMVGPFASPKHAESFIIATAWFTGRKE